MASQPERTLLEMYETHPELVTAFLPHTSVAIRDEQDARYTGGPSTHQSPFCFSLAALVAKNKMAQRNKHQRTAAVTAAAAAHVIIINQRQRILSACVGPHQPTSSLFEAKPRVEATCHPTANNNDNGTRRPRAHASSSGGGGEGGGRDTATSYAAAKHKRLEKET